MNQFDQYRIQQIAAEAHGRKIEKVAVDMGLTMIHDEILFDSEAQQAEFERRIKELE